MKNWSIPGFVETRELGAGSSGRVVMAVEQSTGDPVAIKYLDARLAGDSRFLQAFRTEAGLLRDLRSPHVARFHRYVESEEGAALVMELIDGPSLRTLLWQEGATIPEAALTVLKGSLLGLCAAHGAGIVHRDYKPENVLVTGDGVSKLVDFGIAARDGSTPSGAGTPMYMAPEQWQGEAASPATDVYAATATFFECLTGVRPFQGEHLAEIAVQHLSAEVPLGSVPELVRPLIERGMAKRPLDRPASAADFLAELEAVAVAGYGDEWEERGLHALALRAAGLMVGLLEPFDGGAEEATTSLATTELDGTDGAQGVRRPGRLRSGGDAVNAGRSPRAGRRLRGPVLVGAGVLAVVAVLTAIAVSGGPSSHQASSSSPGDGTRPVPGQTTSPSPSGPAEVSASASSSVSPSVSISPGSPSGGADATPTGGGTAGGAAGDGKSGSPSLDPVGPGEPAAATPTGGGLQSPAAGSVAVSGAEITRLGAASSGRAADAAVAVTTTGPEPVTLTLTWYNSDEGGTPGEQDGATETYVLKGRTSYDLRYTHTFRSDRCPRYWGLRISTTPGAESGEPYRDTGALACKIEFPELG
ncbi:serine/threonine-protein kinase [Streptomyces xantholiticus]|uniref:serine/threonine-protein kinase n=1 Tax=Streptomyces xantholiticus TaxID=68285 RepID=UPI0018A6BB71|nr:serine/threonine-protein kinase [Streptomyces xantholiticus]